MSLSCQSSLILHTMVCRLWVHAIHRVGLRHGHVEFLSLLFFTISCRRQLPGGWSKIMPHVQDEEQQKESDISRWSQCWTSRRREACSERKEDPTANARSVEARRGEKEERVKGPDKLEARQQPTQWTRIWLEAPTKLKIDCPGNWRWRDMGDLVELRNIGPLSIHFYNFALLYLSNAGLPCGPTSLGRFPRIASTFSIIAGVRRGRTSSALRLSITCWGLDAPRITVDVCGCLAIHASASAVGVVLSSRYQVSNYKS